MLSLPVIAFIHLLFLNHGNFGIVSFLDFFTGSSGAGKDLKSGGKTKGFFLITKNSSLFSNFLPDSPSLTDWQDVKRVIKIK